jgi:hypothetical protein
MLHQLASAIVLTAVKKRKRRSRITKNKTMEKERRNQEIKKTEQKEEKRKWG